MPVTKPSALMTAAGILMFILIFQIVGVLRYQARLPSDWLGIVLYMVTIAGALGAALILLFRLRSRNDEVQ